VLQLRGFLHFIGADRRPFQAGIAGLHSVLVMERNLKEAFREASQL
jgi:hypothetical protein